MFRGKYLILMRIHISFLLLHKNLNLKIRPEEAHCSKNTEALVKSTLFFYKKTCITSCQNNYLVSLFIIPSEVINQNNNKTIIF